MMFSERKIEPLIPACVPTFPHGEENGNEGRELCAYFRL